MKLNKLKYLLPALLFALPACTEDEDLMQNIQDSHASSMEFSAVNGNPKSLSKTRLANGWGMFSGNNPSDVIFTSSDRIGVFSTGETAAEFEVKGLGENGSKAIFVGDTEKSADYFALYPYQSTAKIEGNKISATIPTAQAVVHDNMDGNAALSVAYTTNEARAFAFQNVTAMIGFVSTGSYTKITVEAIDGTKIAGDIAVEVAKDGGAPIVSGGTESAVSIEGNISSGDGYCVMLKPCSVKKGQLKFTFTKQDGTSFSQTNENDVTLEAGVCYNYGYIGDTKLTVYDGKEVAFVKYVDLSYNNGTLLPEIPCEEGYVYVYNTAADGSGFRYCGGNWYYFNEDASLYLQKEKGCVVKIYDPEGTGIIYTKTVSHNQWYYFPNDLASADGKKYAFSTTKGGEIEYHRGNGFNAVDFDELVFYAIYEQTFTLTIYGDGANAEPTFKQDYFYDDGLELPQLPEADDIIYRYSYEPDGAPAYGSGNWIYIRENTTLYVVSRPKVTVRFYNNDGSLERTSVVAKGEYVWLPNYLVPDGYDYVAYATEPGGEAKYKVGSSIVADESIDLYVVYYVWGTSSRDLTPEGFSSWTDWVNGEIIGAADCAYVIGEPTDLPYGDGSVNNYINLTAYKALVVVVSEGEPRFLLNRDEDYGQSPDHLINIPNDEGQTAAYETIVDNGDGTRTYTIDLAKIVADRGFAHLHAIKGANWANVTVNSMKIVSASSTADEDEKLAYNVPKTIIWKGQWAAPTVAVEDDWAYVTVVFDGGKPENVQFYANSDYQYGLSSWEYQATYLPVGEDGTTTIDLAAELEKMKAIEGDQSTKVTKIGIQYTVDISEPATAYVKAIIATLNDGTKKLVRNLNAEWNTEVY